jgi:hypothetical protein
MTTQEHSGLAVIDGVITGELRRSVNNSRTAKGSIHDDATASKLGFRGGTVAGSIHMELFAPLLRQAFGQRWWETGSLSLYFQNATTDREAVRAHLKQPPAGASDAQVEAWVLREDGMHVAQGTAAVGHPSEPSALLGRPLDRFDVGELRMLAGIEPGRKFEPVTVICTEETQQQRLGLTTEPMDWYRGENAPFDGTPVMIAPLVQLLYARSVATLRGGIGQAVGLFGAIEVRNVNGPAIVGQEYTCTGEVVAVGQSPKTEHMWFETGLDDDSGRRVAEMRMLLRWMKASSPLYPELRSQ